MYSSCFVEWPSIWDVWFHLALSSGILHYHLMSARSLCCKVAFLVRPIRNQHYLRLYLRPCEYSLPNFSQCCKHPLIILVWTIRIMMVANCGVLAPAFLVQWWLLLSAETPLPTVSSVAPSMQIPLCTVGQCVTFSLSLRFLLLQLSILKEAWTPGLLSILCHQGLISDPCCAPNTFIIWEVTRRGQHHNCTFLAFLPCRWWDPWGVVAPSFSSPQVLAVSAQ